MPVLTFKTNAALEPAQRVALARDLTRVAAQTLGKQVDVTAVLMEALPAASWIVGLQQAPRPTAWLEICITAGTNSAAQKADFIAASWDRLHHHLAADSALEDASYVTVREIAATDWGYGGLTQHARKARLAGV